MQLKPCLNVNIDSLNELGLLVSTNFLLNLESDPETIPKAISLLNAIARQQNKNQNDVALNTIQSILFRLAEDPLDRQMVEVELDRLMNSTSSIGMRLHTEIEPLVNTVFAIDELFKARQLFLPVLVTKIKELQSNFDANYAVPVINSITDQALAKVNAELDRLTGTNSLRRGHLLNVKGFLKRHSTSDPQKQDAR